MEVLHRKKIVVLGMMSKMPVAGVVWQTAHYLVGLQRLGYDVYYVEAHARTPTTLMTSDADNGTHLAVAFIEQACRRFGFEHRWAYHALHDDGRVHGMAESALSELYREAALIINLHGGTLPRPEHYATGRLVYLETDPVAVQIELHHGAEHTVHFLEPHCAFFTFGENYGRPDCRLPVSRQFDFRPTRQPVVLDFWDHLPPAPADAPLTTIGNWEQAWRQVEFEGETYHWSKHLEFLKVLDLPKRLEGRVRFQLALSQYDDEVERMLRAHGWDVRRAMVFSMDCDAYQDYIAGSLGEFTVAKDQNIRLRSGWFSDRSATYLAAGRPVITQDTAFGDILPTGDGLFSFTTLDDARGAVEAIRSDYGSHCRGAAAVARECFSHEVVLRPLLQHLGL
jgi:hypothetical protein